MEKKTSIKMSGRKINFHLKGFIPSKSFCKLSCRFLDLILISQNNDAIKIGPVPLC